MIQRTDGNLKLLEGEAPESSRQLLQDGYTLLSGVLEPELVTELERELLDAYTRPGPRDELDSEFRHEMLNFGAVSQRAVRHPALLATIEPLLGEDCHVIANTAWNNPPTFKGGQWHCDAGPHVPRPAGVPWDDRIPYPIFALGAHLYLRDCPLSSGPTAVVPGSHRSGRLPPAERLEDPTLSYDGRPPLPLVARAGDVSMFVSDAWHRGLPALPGATGRLFLQVHYARRDIAQRLRTTSHSNQLSESTILRIESPRERLLLGLHDKHFYDG